MIKDYFKLALDSLVHKKLRSWLTLLGILIGVMAVVALIGLGEGLRTAITSQFGISTTEVLTVQAGGISAAGPPGMGAVNQLTLDDSDAIERLSLVESAMPRILATGMLEFNDMSVFGSAMTIPDGEDRKFAYDVLDLEMKEGRLLKDGDVNKVVLGYNFYDNTVGLEKRVRVGNSVLINDRKFEVVGITDKKGSFIFDNIVHMNEEPLRDLFDTGDDVNIIVARVKNANLMQEAKKDIEKLLRDRRDVDEGEEDFEVSTPDDALSDLNDILTGVQVFVVIIASISIIIGAIGIINTMFTSVMERKSQIGVMKSVGAKNSDIFYIFFFESGLMGLMGGVIGIVFGTLISYTGTVGINNWVNSSASPQINLVLISSALLGSFFIGALSGVPAMKAARQNPVDALRG